MQGVAPLRNRDQRASDDQRQQLASLDPRSDLPYRFVATVCIEGDRGELRSGVRGRSGLTDVIAIQRDVGAETRDIDEPDLRIRDVESIAKR